MALKLPGEVDVWQELNLNDEIRVKLFPHGFKVHKETLCAIPTIRRDYCPPEVDAEGRSTFTLWYFMNIFGPHMTMAGEQVCATTFEICTGVRARTPEELEADLAAAQVWGDGP
jgi:hypothetical protein